MQSGLLRRGEGAFSTLDNVRLAKFVGKFSLEDRWVETMQPKKPAPSHHVPCRANTHHHARQEVQVRACSRTWRHGAQHVAKKSSFYIVIVADTSYTRGLSQHLCRKIGRLCGVCSTKQAEQLHMAHFLQDVGGEEVWGTSPKSERSAWPGEKKFCAWCISKGLNIRDPSWPVLWRAIFRGAVLNFQGVNDK